MRLFSRRHDVPPNRQVGAHASQSRIFLLGACGVEQTSLEEEVLHSKATDAPDVLQVGTARSIARAMCSSFLFSRCGARPRTQALGREGRPVSGVGKGFVGLGPQRAPSDLTLSGACQEGLRGGGRVQRAVVRV